MMLTIARDNGRVEKPVPAPRTHAAVRGLCKSFGDAVLYNDFDLNIEKGMVTTVFGPNGCGKSTLIGMMSGIIANDGGSVLYEGRGIADMRIGYVFQNYRDVLFPWLTALENIRYPLKFMGLPPLRQKEYVERIVDQVNVGIDLKRYPYELSGGQQQTVSIMRALVVRPEILFLDEPFSALDYEMTLFMRDLLQRIQIETRITMMVVSHDLEDAVYLADRILLLKKHPTRISKIISYDAPRPRTLQTLADPAFIRAKQEALQTFQEDVRGGAASHSP